MRISEMKGAELDYWVARAEGMRAGGKNYVAYSTQWAVCGPLMEKHDIGSGREHDGKWYAEIDGYPSDSAYGSGDTLMEAVCRCVVRFWAGVEDIKDSKP